jgi:hypothetical protein
MSLTTAHGLQPLGFFAVLSFGKQQPRARETLRELSGRLHGDAESVAAYLRAGTVLLALMEQTFDLLDDKFTTAGGSGITTDGRYFWRVDTADYVEHYRVALPDGFLRHGAARGWAPTTLTSSDTALADEEVAEFYRAGSDSLLWPDRSSEDTHPRRQS